MTNSFSNEGSFGKFGEPVTTSFEDVLALPVSQRIVVIEDCPEIILPQQENPVA